MKDPARAIDAFSYFIKTFPDDPQTPIALTQRALAYQQSNNAEAAIGDLSFLIANYPKAKEREAAIQQKALLLGEQNREPEMAQTFQQLLKEYPKSSAVAQANYYIGKAAFDGKDYKRAITFSRYLAPIKSGAILHACDAPDHPRSLLSARPQGDHERG
jgi:TolA-binding protein